MIILMRSFSLLVTLLLFLLVNDTISAQPPTQIHVNGAHLNVSEVKANLISQTDSLSQLTVQFFNYLPNQNWGVGEEFRVTIDSIPTAKFLAFTTEDQLKTTCHITDIEHYIGRSGSDVMHNYLFDSQVRGTPGQCTIHHIKRFGDDYTVDVSVRLNAPATKLQDVYRFAVDLKAAKLSLK